MPFAASGYVISTSTQIVDGIVTGADIANLTITDANISGSAAIAYSKLSLANSITNADLAGSIADSKLSQITTAGKVSGAALTSLASIPSGAGNIPAANLGLATGNPAWVDEGSLSWAAETADKTLTLANTGKSQYLVIFAFSVYNTQASIQLNGDTGAHYAHRGLTSAAVQETTGANNIPLGPSTNGPLAGSLLIPGKAVNSLICFPINTGLIITGANYLPLMGQWNTASDLTSITIKVAASSVTGKVHVYSLAL